MKIKTVGYGRVINTGNYESIRYYLEAEVEGDEHWFLQCLTKLVEEVNTLEGGRKKAIYTEQDIKDLEQQKDRLSRQIKDKKNKLEELRQRWNLATNFLKQQGIDPTSPGFDFLPPEADPEIDPEPDSPLEEITF